MARKKVKKSTETQEINPKTDEEVLKGPVVSDGTLYLSPYDLARLELVHQRHLNRRQALEISRFRTRELHARYEAELVAVRAEEGQALMQVKMAEKEVETLRAELAKLYSLDFSAVTYSPTTGQLTLHDKPILSSSGPSVLGNGEAG